MTIQNHEPGEPLEGADSRLPALQSVADPAPLGLGAFAMTTLALSLFNANVWPAAIFPALALALVFGGFAQLLAGMWEFVRKNTFGATAFTSFGGFGTSYYLSSTSWSRRSRQGWLQPRPACSCSAGPSSLS